jgi:putative membrane protein
MMWYGGWGWFWMCIAMLAFWALVAWVIVTLVRQGSRGRRSDSDAQTLLEERLARGEIDEDEYQRRRDLIRH